MTYVFRPVKAPPKLNEYATLSSEAQKTLAALEKKYSSLLNYLQVPVVQHHDPENYYKTIYKSSFSKSLSTPDSESGNNESCTKLWGENFVESQFKCTTEANSNVPLEHVQEFDKTDILSSRYKKCEQKSSTFQNKHSKNKHVTEVFLEHRPSDEEIAESVLLLTQRTSLPGSPCMDLNNSLMEFEQLDDSICKPSVIGEHTTENSLDHTSFSELSVINIASASEESCMTSVSLYPEKHSEDLYHISTRLSPVTTKCKKKETEEITGLVSMGDDVNRKNEDSPNVIFSSLDHDSLCVNKDDILSDDNNGPELYITNCEKSADILKTVEKADFELNLSGTEFSQFTSFSQAKCHDKFKTRKDSKVLESSPSSLFKEDESHYKDRQSENIENMLLSEMYENPLQVENLKYASSASVIKKVKKCNNEDLVTPIKFSKAQKSSCENESPYMENTGGQSKKFKSDVKISRTKPYRNKLLGCTNQQEINNIFPNVKHRNENSSKDFIQKRNSEQCSNPCAKKVKMSFKPPQVKDSKRQILLTESDVINLSKLSSEKQQETFSLLESCQALTLTLLYNTNVTLTTTFYSAADYAKKKNSTLQPQIVGLVILEGDITNRFILIPTDLLSRYDVIKTLLSILSSKRMTKIIANCKEFLTAVHRLSSLYSEHGIPCENLEDPVIACWLVDPENQPSDFFQMCKTAKMQCNSAEENWQACLQFVPKLMQAFRHKLKADKLWPVFTQIEMKLIPILACMETHTIKVDTELLVKFSEILKSKINKLKEAVYKEAGRKFSLNSHVQLRQILYEDLELDKKLQPEVKIGKTDVSNQKSTCESSLNLLADVHPLPALILEYRQMQKLMSTYVDGMLSCVTNGSLTTHWDQTAAATGRLTSSQPNIQAIPKNVITVKDYQTNYVIGAEKTTDVDINVREPFISSSGYIFLAADFQQIEFRVLAHLSGDSTLQSLFRNIHGEDVFISLVKQWHNKTSEEITPADREQAKRVVYSVMYGVGKDKLSEYLKVKPDIAKDIITSFLQQFPAIESFTKTCWSFAQKFGYTETVCGRRRYFPNINSILPVLRSQAQRQAVNFCVQGSAADICKIAMIAVENKLKDYSHISSRLLIQIHDELIWEVPVEQLMEIKGIIQQVMEDTKDLCGTLFSFQVPLTVVLRSGKSWAHLNPFV